MKEEEKASEIECHQSRLEKALEEIAAAAAEDTVENDKKKTDNAKAAEMRNRGCRKPERNTGKRLFSCILLICHHMIFVVQFGVNKHLQIFSKTTICWSWKKFTTAYLFRITLEII